MERGIPDEFVNLKAQADGKAVGQNPLRQFAGIQQALASRTLALRGRPERGRKMQVGDALRQAVAAEKIAGEFVVAAAGEDEFGSAFV